MKQPRKKLSAEILKMVEESAKVPPPTRAREASLDLNRKREPQDMTRVPTRVPPKRMFSDDIPHRRPLEHYEGEVNVGRFTPLKKLPRR